MTEAPDFRYERVADLAAAPSNPRRHDLAGIKASIRRLGFRDPVGLDGRTGRVAEGHGRCEALLAMQAEGEDPPRYVQTDDDGFWLVPVFVSESQDDDEATAFLVAHNRLTERGKWARDEADELVRALPEDLAEVTAYTPDDMPEPGTAPDQRDKIEQQYLVIVCVDEEQQHEVLRTCDERGWQCRALI